MIVDTSVIIAILRQEVGFDRYLNAIATARPSLSISAASLLEAGVVTNRADDAQLREQLKDLISSFSIDVIPFDEGQAWRAIEAHQSFGKGSGHPAQLNFGDCFAYALAKDRGEPLLFKGNDFAQTDAVSAL